MDLSRLPIGADPGALLRRCARRLLIRGDVRALLLGGLHLMPPMPSPQPPADVAVALGPYRRTLWRRRTALLFARLLPAVITSVLILNLVRLALLPSLPRWACWLSAAVLLPLGIWVAFCQRPSLGETARLLDRRFGLRDSLGTAAEPGVVASGSLGERQRRQALATLDRLPARPWGGGAGGWGRAILPALVVVAVGCTLAGSAHQGTGPTANNAAVAYPLGLAHVPVQPAGASSGQASVTSLAAQHPRQENTVSPHPDLFVTSFQVHAAPVGAALPTGSTAQGAPGQVALDGSSDASGGQAGTASAALSGAARNGAGQKGSSTTGTAGKSGQGKGASAGLGSQPSRTQAQGGQQGSGEGGARGATAPAPQQGSQDGQGSATSSNSAQPPGGSKGQGGAQGANPFGQDARPSSPKSSGSGQGGTAGAPQASARRAATAPNGARAQRAGQPTGRAAPRGQEGMDPTRRGRGASPSGTSRRNAPAPGQARTAQGRELDLGGHAISGQQATGAQLVRVLPMGGVSLPGAAGSTQTGPTTVQGYVPEDSSDLSPEEQALLKVYFANGGGS